MINFTLKFSPLNCFEYTINTLFLEASELIETKSQFKFIPTAKSH